MERTVDKRSFLAGIECLTKGWRTVGTKEALTPALEWRFYAGAEVATKARDWLGPGRMLRRTPIDEALNSTAEALAHSTSTLLFEASFHSRQCSARADALRREGDGWNLLEIKAGTTPKEDKHNPEYIDDITYTTWVASSAGLNWLKSTLVLVNRGYRLGGTTAMFVEFDVTQLVRERMIEFERLSHGIIPAETQNEKPAPALQFACRHCDHFANDCVGAGIDDPLFVIPRISEKKFMEIRQYERVSRIPLTTKLTEIQQRVVDVIQSGCPRADSDGLRLLDSIEFPVYYLDFETVSPHLPWFGDRPPYDATPFQYSLHVRHSLTGPLEHQFYLAPLRGDWRNELVTRLLAALGSSGSIVVYTSFERARLGALAQVFPHLAPQIEAVIARLFDLEDVVSHGYIHPGFGGRTSIKKVLPVIAPDLNYAKLHISGGEDAAGTFALMRVGKTPDELHAFKRAALEEYCHQDTLAMVRIHDFLLWERRKLDA